jgi:hypothetical protein
VYPVQPIRLLAAVGKQRGLQVKTVSYLTLDDMRSKKLKTAELPFLKRFAFQHESEVRMIYESATKRLRKLDIPIPLSCIDKITLSPWIHPSPYSYVKEIKHS